MLPRMVSGQMMEATNAQKTIAHTRHDGSAFTGQDRDASGAEFGTAEEAKAALWRPIIEKLSDFRPSLSPRFSGPEYGLTSAHGANISGINPARLRRCRIGYLHPAFLASHGAEFRGPFNHVDNCCRR